MLRPLAGSNNCSSGLILGLGEFLFVLHLLINVPYFREKPGSDESNHLEDLKIPLLLNYSQCKLLSCEYYEVIEHTSQVLKREPG